MPLLTIAIPTYNRAKSLKELIHILLAEESTEFIEILISDNNSEDDTKEVVTSFSSTEIYCIEYYKNETNIGFDGNVLNCYKKAKGRFIWFLSDDDRFETDVFRILIPLLKSEDPSLLALRSNSPTIRNVAEYIETDLVPYNVTGIKFYFTPNRINLILNERQRLAAVLMTSQISHCLVKNLKLNNINLDSGGLMHSQIANFTLLAENRFVVVNNILIRPGEKEYLSTWFMESALFGCRILYSLPQMQFSKENLKIVSCRTANFGLRLLSLNYTNPNFIKYKEIDSVIIQNLKDLFGKDFKYLITNILIAKFYKKLYTLYLRII